MRKVGLQFLRGDEVLGRALFDEEGRILLREGVIIKPSFIRKLQELGIGSVYIDDALSQGIEINDVVSEETRQESKKTVAETMQRLVRRGDVSLKGVISSASRVIDDILSQKEVVVNLIDIRSKEDVLFSHSVNVCILAVMTGLNMGYNLSLLKELAVGALLHDIGMTQIIALENSNAETKKTDWSRFKEHPKLGYDILNRQEISAYAKMIALTHHEHCDGSGFPLGLQQQEIHEMAKIVSVCNAFDCISHGDRMVYDVPAHHAVEFLETSIHVFDKTIVQKFVANISLYPAGSRVRLSTGEDCIVVRQNAGFAARPVVRLLQENALREIDLSEQLTLFIEQAYEE